MRDAAATRAVQGACTAVEHAAIRAACPEHGAISALVREAIDRLERAKLEPSGDLAGQIRYVGAQLTPDEIEALATAAQACGLEPTVLLRLVVTARVRTGTGDALWRALQAARR